MNRFNTHLCLVSAQATPNLAPALDPDFAPQRVVLAVSHDMQRQAQWLAAVLKRHQIRVETLDIADPYDFAACWECFANWMGGQDRDVALNVTGGTKVMAMAAQDVFRNDDERPVFYINIENDQVVRIDRRDAGFVLPTKVRLREYLEAHGYGLPGKPHKPELPASRRELVQRLAYESERLGRALGRLNWLAKEAQRNLTTPELDPDDQDSRTLDELISVFSAEGLMAQKGKRLSFPDDEARRFVNGGWLEMLVYHCLAQLSPELGLADYATSLEVLAPDGKTRNEIDAACLHRNTLYLVECKSANLAASGRTGGESGAEALYKLDTLRKMGGLRTKAMLVDFRGSLTEHDRRRAAQMGLRIVAGRQLRDVQGELRRWLSGTP
ncbi:MAG: DUF1887 family protein [Betaproteobacteria bacterium]|nr:DUF1887 family protein [Betaproteobacteria bacterium]